MTGAPQSSPPCLEPPTREAALSIVARDSRALFAAERTVVPAERLGRALDAPMRVLPDRGELTIEIESTTCHRSFPRSHLAWT
jgi:hypothetical protein